ncbi:PD-(D/E)XK motif protein [Bacillus sp. YC2]|uniref:PD-(D/E)XK motif protein n=1 Tax=Bacillus sp. YC2 TaxID=2861287 RepID=UPI001CA60B95|nr:PD-(D/E)XK motif protein [Bacillus sp. YC2]MBY8911932.1 PD-(D/E)XK motif protein [Bacillus sp. YC2]
MVSIKNEFREMFNESSQPVETSPLKLRLVLVDPVAIFAGINPSSKQRVLFITAGKRAWEREHITSLPKWKGMTISFDFHSKIGPFENEYVIAISQEKGYDAEVFISVLQNILEVIALKTEAEELYPLLYRTLDKWKSFFSKGGFKKLTEEQQKGLFGELYFIKKWIEQNPGIPPTLINCWEGPLTGRLDFNLLQHCIEIKTATEKIGKSVKISNEKQLVLTEATQSIYLYVCFIENSRTHGTSLDAMVSTIRGLIEDMSQEILLIFNELLIKAGYRDGEYDEDLFVVNSVEVYDANEKFPRILPESLHSAISHVSYSIDLKACEEFRLEESLSYNIQ